jgi:hypothetical protein
MAWNSGVSTHLQQVGQPKGKVVRWGKWNLRVTEHEWALLLRIAGGSYPSGLKPHVKRVLGREAENVNDVRHAFSKLSLELFSESP